MMKMVVGKKVKFVASSSNFVVMNAAGFIIDLVHWLRTRWSRPVFFFMCFLFERQEEIAKTAAAAQKQDDISARPQLQLGLAL